MNFKAGTGKVAVIAHRGGAGLFPENTMKAFTGVQKYGVDGIELDIHATRDGRLVVVHDPDLNRLAGLDRLVSEMSHDEIAEVELASGDRIPDLESVLEGVDIPLYIELKDPKAVQPLIRIFRNHPEYIGKSSVISFLHELLKPFRDEFPGIVTGALVAELPEDPVSIVENCGASMLAVYYMELTGEYVKKCHEAGIMVNVWTPNDENVISDMIEAGVDSITSDRPDIVKQILERRRKKD